MAPQVRTRLAGKERDGECVVVKAKSVDVSTAIFRSPSHVHSSPIMRTKSSQSLPVYSNKSPGRRRSKFSPS